jgi:hypothetical protein
VRFSADTGGLHTVEVTGSNPVPPTRSKDLLLQDRRDLPSSDHEHADEPRCFKIGDHRPVILEIDDAVLAGR